MRRSRVTLTMGILMAWRRSKTTLGWASEKRARGSEYRQLFQLVLLKREQRMEAVVCGRGHGVEGVTFS